MSSAFFMVMILWCIQCDFFPFVADGGSENVVPRPLNPPPRRVQDRERLYAKIQEDLDKDRRVLEKPRMIGRPDESSSSSPNPNRQAQMGAPSKNGGDGLDVSANALGLPSPDANGNNLVNPIDKVIAQPKTHTNSSGGVIVVGGADPDPEVDKKREFIKKVSTIHTTILLVLLHYPVFCLMSRTIWIYA